MATVNHQVRLKARPAGIPQARDFEVVAAPMPEPRDGQFLVRNLYLSVDPAMRGWVSAVANYSKPVEIGEVMRSRDVGAVIASRHPGYRVGEHVVGWLGWQEYAVSDGTGIIRRVAETDLPLSAALGVLGMNGVTAYFGLLDVGQPEPGETVVVSPSIPPPCRPARAGRHRAGRDGGGIDGGGRRRLGGRPDRQDQRLPHRRHRRRAWEGAALPRGIRL